MTAVEHGEVENYARKETAFREAKKSAGNEQTCIRLDEAGTGRDDTPGEEQCGQEIAGLEVLEHPIRGDVNWRAQC